MTLNCWQKYKVKDFGKSMAAALTQSIFQLGSFSTKFESLFIFLLGHQFTTYFLGCCRKFQTLDVFCIICVPTLGLSFPLKLVSLTENGKMVFYIHWKHFGKYAAGLERYFRSVTPFTFPTRVIISGGCDNKGIYSITHLSSTGMFKRNKIFI